MTTWLAGMKVTAARLNDNADIVITQGSDVTITNSTTLVDSGIVVPCDADSLYTYDMYVIYSADPAADLKWSWTLPSGATINRALAGYGDAATASGTAGQPVVMRAPAATTAPQIGGTGIANYHMAMESGRFATGSTAGNFTMQWAQFTASTTGSILRSSTAIAYRKIG